MIVLVDTSVWRRHFRERDPVLEALLAARRVVTHDGVLHELVLGGVSPAVRRSLEELRRLAAHDGAAVLAAIDRHRLARTGLGAIDAQLFHAALSAQAALYTSDKALRAVFRPYQPSSWREHD